MPTESDRYFGLVISGVGRWVSEGKAGDCSLRSQNVSGLWFGVKEETVLPIMIELVVLLNHLGVVHLWRLQNKKWPIVYPPHPLLLQKWTIYLLFKNKRICRHVDLINIWSLMCLPWYELFFCSRKNYHTVVWTKQANHQNIA